MSAFHFLRPAWFLALIPALILLILAWRRRTQSLDWRGIVAPALLPLLLLKAGRPLSRLPLALLAIGWLLAITALAGPTWERQSQPVYRAPADRVLVLDMSPSMGASDLKPDRLTQARFTIQNLLGGIKEGRIALVVFGSEPHVVVPLTDDVATIKALLPALSLDIMPAPGDQAGSALREAGKLLKQAASQQGQVLLLSDGISDPADAMNAIQTLRQQGVRTSVIGVGTLQGAPLPTAQGGFETGADGNPTLVRLNEAGLVQLAKTGGGRYLRLGQGSVQDLLQGSGRHNLSHASQDRGGVQHWVERGPWLLLPLLLIAAGGFRRGWLGLLALFMVMPPQAHAFGWQDLWLRPDQQASQLLQQGKSKAAAALFQDPHWRATALYQAGDYSAAAKGFSGRDADSLFNRGNALARSGQLKQALAAYDQALQQHPDDKDAKFNRDLVARLLQKKAPQNGQNQNGKPGQKSAGEKDQQHDSQGKDTQPKRDTQGGQSSAGDPSKPTRPKPSTAENGAKSQANANRQQTPSRSADGKPPKQPSGSEPNPQKAAATKPNPADSEARARADVTPSGNHHDGKKPNDATQQQGKVNGTQEKTAQPAKPLSERQIALEQWLQQIPDDPSGLLRRKFMLEHLLRQNGESKQ